nr:MAG TPA: hypothetical protein [Caudoviricetes sp.]
MIDFNNGKSTSRNWLVLFPCKVINLMISYH